MVGIGEHIWLGEIDENSLNIILYKKGKEFLKSQQFDEMLSNIISNIFCKKYKVNYIENIDKNLKVKYQEEQLKKQEEVIKQFYIFFNAERFTTSQAKEKFEKRGMEIIENYYPYFVEFPIESVEIIEFSFDCVKVGEDYIKGKIDRIEKNNDGTYCLYDYKTGTPASEKKFAPGEEKEGYYNQLCFYKYAFEKFSDKTVSQVGVIYVENHEKSVYKRLTTEDMHYIEDKIKKTYKNIKDIKFNPINETRDGACKFCAYKHLCRLDVI